MTFNQKVIYVMLVIRIFVHNDFNLKYLGLLDDLLILFGHLIVKDRFLSWDFRICIFIKLFEFISNQ